MIRLVFTAGRRGRPFSVVILSFFATFVGPIVNADVGRTIGSFKVAPSGSANYSIPIWTPPGPGGVQPHLALTYDSHSGNSPFGYGWSLSGLSAIYRCNATYAQDAAPGAVALNSNDRFCLDGQRLRLTSSEDLSTYGQPGTTYQTEVADFRTMTANGTAGSGPGYFTAYSG